MARRTDAPEVDVDETVAVDEELETVPVEDEKPAKTPKAKKEPARGTLPEGYVTPIGLAKELTARGMHTNREGQVVAVAPQMVYSYINNAPKEHPFPMETVTDSIGKERQAVELEAGLTWWTEKNARAAERRQNAAAKASKKAEKKATVEAEGEVEAETVEVEATEAE